jgi:hypothetical protein
MEKDHCVYQMAIEDIKIFHSKALGNWDVWYENIPSGNPG